MLDLSGFDAPLYKIVDLEVPRSSRGGGTSITNEILRWSCRHPKHRPCDVVDEDEVPGGANPDAA